MRLYEAVHLVKSKRFKHFHTSTSVLYGFAKDGSFYSKDRDGSGYQSIAMSALTSAIKTDQSEDWKVS